MEELRRSNSQGLKGRIDEDEDEVSGGDEDYGMRSVDLIRAVRPPWLLHELNAFDRTEPRPL